MGVEEGELRMERRNKDWKEGNQGCIGDLKPSLLSVSTFFFFFNFFSLDMTVEGLGIFDSTIFMSLISKERTV